MDDTEKCNTEMMQRLNSSFGTSSSSIPKNNRQLNIPQLNPNLIRKQFAQFPRPFNGVTAGYGGDNGQRVGVPPSYSQIPMTHQPNSQTFSHSRSMSQPSSFFSFDSLPPLSPSFRDSLPVPAANATAARDVSMEDRNSNNGFPPLMLTSSVSSRVNDSPPPRKSHRRSISEIPTGLNSMIVQNIPYQRSVSGMEFTDWSKTAPFVKRESEREAMDDLFSAYMNLENIDILNSSEANDMKNKEEIGSDTEGENSVNEKENVKRRAIGDLDSMNRHYRSVSVDSSFMEKLSFGDESLKPPPSPRSLPRKASPTTSVDENSGTFSLKVKKVSFTALEMKKIMANEKLAELIVDDPKRVKRIFDNRRSAARSKERKTRYMFELERKVQTLQTEATTLSAQCTLMEREMMGLTDQNRDLKYRIQSMKKQELLQQALNDTLAAEVQRLKLVIGEASYDRFGAPNECDRFKMQPLNSEMFQQLDMNQLRCPRLQFQNQNQNRTMVTKPESY